MPASSLVSEFTQLRPTEDIGFTYLTGLSIQSPFMYWSVYLRMLYLFVHISYHLV